MAKCEQVGWPNKVGPQTASQSGAVPQTAKERVGPGAVASSVCEQRRQDKLFLHHGHDHQVSNQDYAHVG